MILMKLKKIICLAMALAISAAPCIPASAAEVCAVVSTSRLQISYTSFTDAWKKAVELGDSSEVTFKLNKNWKANNSGSLGSGSGFKNGGLSYSGANNLTIDLNGCYIDRNLITPQENGAVIFVNSTMTIKDSKSGTYTVSNLFKGGAIKNGANEDRGGGIVVGKNAKLNFNGGTILNCISTDDGGAISAEESGAVIKVNGGSFYGNRTYDSKGECCGGAIYASESTVTISNAVFEGNYAEDNGGAIYVDDGKLTISSSSFYSNSSIEEGGAIFLDGDVKTSISDSVFSQNSSTDDDGGAVFCDSDDGTYFNDCKMYYNHSASEGGAIHINDDKVFVIGGDYQYNTASEYGGGIYVDSLNDINAAGKLIIQNNTVSDKASDLCLQDGKASTAYLYCGGFYEGSSIYLCSNDTNSQLAIKNIDKFQYNNYIHFDSGFSQDKVNSSATSSNDVRAVASAFSGGNVIFICVCVVAIAVLAVLAVKIKRKKDNRKEEE